jgi:ABC-type antimicrobial peptide transport system permease subunit
VTLLTHDLRQALRALRRNPGFTAAAAFTLALGIGAATVIFSAVNAILLAPPPFPEPGRLLSLWENIALGARGRQIFRLVTGGGVKLVVWGLVLGSAAALAATRLLESLLFEVRPTDPVTYAAIASLMLAVGLVAGTVPARKAARIDPLDALRSE